MIETNYLWLNHPKFWMMIFIHLCFYMPVSIKINQIKPRLQICQDFDSKLKGRGQFLPQITIQFPMFY